MQRLHIFSILMKTSDSSFFLADVDCGLLPFTYIYDRDSIPAKISLLSHVRINRVFTLTGFLWEIILLYGNMHQKNKRRPLLDLLREQQFRSDKTNQYKITLGIL
jgi:hypothetical protein